MALSPYEVRARQQSVGGLSIPEQIERKLDEDLLLKRFDPRRGAAAILYSDLSSYTREELDAVSATVAVRYTGNGWKQVKTPHDDSMEQRIIYLLFLEL